MSRRKPRGFFMNRKPQTIKCTKSNKAPKPTVPLTERAIEDFGGIGPAKKAVERLLGYPVEIKQVKNLPEDLMLQLKPIPGN